MSEMKIPITVCHGANDHLTVERFSQLVGMASELGFTAINYDQLYSWLTEEGELPNKPIVFDFDHPVLSTYESFFPVLQAHGFVGNLFVNTGCLDEVSDAAYASWSQVAELAQAGWTIGAHTHTHPNLSVLLAEDPTGENLRLEMTKNNQIIQSNLGFEPEYFAFTGAANGITWSDVAEKQARNHYKLGRLWILDSRCEVNGSVARYADFMGSTAADEADGGPPEHLRYITKQTPHFKLPAMELEGLIFEPEAFRRYLVGASG